MLPYSARRLYHKARRDSDPSRYLDYTFRKAYGIRLVEYERMLADQGGVCAICHGPETRKFRGRVKRLAVDHDHRTGKIRALLCQSCNYTLGLVKEDPTILAAMIEFLRRHSDS